MSRTTTSKTAQAPGISFPPAWLWLVDEAIPAWVKSRYSPQESWKTKPFGKEDAKFFFKGIEELSDIFTEERDKALSTYFQHPKYRSAYLLYFLPLQASKMISLFHLYPEAMKTMMDHAREKGVLRIWDLGVGPGTASLALLLWLLTQPEVPSVELNWVDTQRGAMEDGEALARQLADSFPRMRGKLKINTHVGPWWKAPEMISGDASLILMGNVLNEAQGPRDERIWPEMMKRAKGGGILMVEPAARRPSQLLSQLRDELLEKETIPAEATSIWGPCLHAGKCPLAEGRDWCHFSVPIQIPGAWFREFSRALSSERQWAKFSYLWLASREQPAPMPKADLRRVISDPLSGTQKMQGPTTVLICEPERPAKFPVNPAKKPVWRGDLVRMGDAGKSRLAPLGEPAVKVGKRRI